MTLGPSARASMLRCREIANMVETGTVRPTSEHWSKGETVKLLEAANKHQLDFHKVSHALGHKSVQECLSHFETVVMEVEQTARNRAARRAERRNNVSAQSVPPPKSEDLWQMAPRLTERQQLAILLQQTSAPILVPAPAPSPAPAPAEMSDSASDASDADDDSDGVFEPAEDVWRPKEYARWGDRRRRAWDSIGRAPDEYYYDFAPPGVTAKWMTEEWSRQEEERLLVTYMLHPPLGKWGLFSMHITGRCGRQCEQTFERLQEEGTVDRFQQVWARRGPIGVKPTSPSPGIRAAFSTPSAGSGMYKGAKRKRTSPDGGAETTPSSKVLDETAAGTDQTPSNPTLPHQEGMKKEAKAGRVRSRLGAHMSPIKLMHLEDADSTKNQEASTVSSLSGITEPVSPLATKPARLAKQDRGFASQSRPLMPTIPQTGNLPLPQTPCFSSAALTSKRQRRPALASSDGSFEQEVVRLEHALEKRKRQLKESCDAQLRRIGEKHASQEDPVLPRFSFTDGCKSLLNMRSEGQGSSVRKNEERLFEIPSATRDQLERRCMYDLEEAEREAERMHQIQLESLTSLQRHGLLFT